MNFAEQLDRITDDSKRLSAQDIARFSALGPADASRLAARWPDVGVRRRRRLVAGMVSLSEDNIEYSFDEVFFIALDDGDPEIKRAAIGGLWENESPSLIGRLIGILGQDPDAGVRCEAALALGRFVLLREHGRLRDRYFAEVEAALRMVIADESEVPEVRSRALEAIGPHDAPWTREAIEKAYASGVHRLRVSALHAMGRSCEPRWFPTLVEALESDEPEIRYEAAVACGAVGDEAAVADLIPLLTDDDEEVRSAVVASLGEIGGPVARRALMDLMDGPSEAIREAAASALALIDFEDDPLGIRPR